MTETKDIMVFDKGFSLVPKNMDEAVKFAELLAKSSVVPTAFKDKAGDILVAVQMGLEVGLKPMQALQNIAVINGRPSVWGDAALAIVQASGLLEDFSERNPSEAVTSGGGWCKAKRKGQATPIERTFTIQDAQNAGLYSKAGVWQNYKGRMLQMRARSLVLRDGFADALKGLHVTEEVMDYTEIKEAEVMKPPTLPKRLSETQAIPPAQVAPAPVVKEEPKETVRPPAPAGQTINGYVKETLIKPFKKKDGSGGEYYVIVLTADGWTGKTFDKKSHDFAMWAMTENASVTITFSHDEKYGNKVLDIREAAEVQQTF